VPKVHKKLIKTGTFPVKWNQSKFKSAHQILLLLFSSLKAHKGWKINTRVFSLIFQEIWYFIRFHQQSFQALNAWEPNYQRDFTLNFDIPHKYPDISQYSKEALGCLWCTPDILVYSPWTPQKLNYLCEKLKPLQKLDYWNIESPTIVSFILFYSYLILILFSVFSILTIKKSNLYEDCIHTSKGVKQ
jgi:hypothetical protein